MRMLGRVALLMVVVLVVMFVLGVQPVAAQGTEPSKLPSYDTMMTLFLAIGAVLIGLVSFVLGKQQGLNEVLKSVQQDTSSQTKWEAQLFNQFGDTGVGLLRSGGMGLTALLLALAPEDWDETLERAKDIFDRLTDGQENLPPA